MIFLVGCTNKEDEELKAEQQVEPEVEQQEVKTEKKDKDPKKLYDIGDVVEEKNYKVTLQRYQTLNKIVKAGPLNINLKEVKFIAMFDTAGDLKSELENAGFDTKEPINYLQILIDVENTSDDVVSMNRVIDKIILNTGEQIELIENDMSQTQYIGDIYGGVKKEIILTPFYEGTPEEIKTMKFVVDEVYTPETYETIEGIQQIDFDLE